MKRKPAKITTTQPDRPPDCVTVTRIGSTTLVVRGYCDPHAKETAEDKLLRIMLAELGYRYKGRGYGNTS